MKAGIKAGWVGGKGFSDWVGETRQGMAIDVQAGVSTATTELRDTLRNQVEQAGFGTRLGNAIGANIYPRSGKASLDAAGYVFPRGRKANAIFDSFNAASGITAHKGRFLAIPTPEAGRGNRNSKPTPEEFQDRTGIKLRFVKTRQGKAFLVGDAIAAKSKRGFRAATPGRLAQGRGRETLVFFILIPVARMPHRLDFDKAAQQWADRIPALIDAARQGGGE